MIKTFYKFLSAAILFLTGTVISSSLLVSCKKNSDKLNPGISYGITGVEPAMAGSGDTIKVYGVGFQSSTSGNTIKVNGVAAKIVAATSSELDVVVPVAPRSGNISVQTGSNSYTFNQTFTVATVLSGNQNSSLTLSASNLYLLKGDVHFTQGTVLTIPAGTIIYASRATRATLTIDAGASVQMNGTSSQPIVFTSDQLINMRGLGDWGGITLAASQATATDVIKYVRIEYAGYHLSDAPGAALLINRNIANGNVQYVQASYSNGDGFRSNGAVGVTQYFKYLVAFGCAGNDFDYAGATNVKAQYLVGLKDPNYADQYGADGLLVQSSQPVVISNLTVMGPDGLARNTMVNSPNYNYDENYDDIINPLGGRGVHIGGYDRVSQSALNGVLQLYNSVVAAPWLAGISVDGPVAWAAYGSGANGPIVKNTSVTYTLATDANTFNHLDPPIKGYVFSSENLKSPVSGFMSSHNTAPGNSFIAANDSAKLQLETPFVQATNPNQTYDDLGLTNMALYTRLSNPAMPPSAGSRLLTSAVFTDAAVTDPFFDHVAFRGAFGTADWTKPWANYVPQQTSY